MSQSNRPTRALLGKGAGKIGGHGGFADAALPAGHGDHFGDAGNTGCTLRLTGRLPTCGSILPFRLLDLHVRHTDALDGLERGLALVLDLLGDLGVGAGQVDRHAHGAVGHGHVLDDPEGDNVP